MLFSKFILSCFFLVAMTSLLTGQRTIEGKITDASNGEALIGANVLVKGASTGTITDFDGNFSLEVPDGYDVVTVSYTGYRAVEITLTDVSVLDVALEPGQLLDEVVVIGYGTVKREDATGSVQSVSSESFNKGAITNPQELLAGKIPGVVITTGGAPGDGATIRVRGESSIGASNSPLIVIDGVPVESETIDGGRNPLSIINPNDIESFTVLKDASASAIYGSRASAGVILITTKKGSAGDKLRIGYNGNVSIGNVTDYVPVLNAEEYRALALQRLDTTQQKLLGDANTDWQKEIYQTAVGHDHNLYLSGGIAKLPFRLSLGYTNREGILKTDQFSRITTGLNLNPGLINNTLQLNIHFKGMFTDNHFANRGAIGNALGFDPTQAIYDPESPYRGFTTWRLNNSPNPNNVASPRNPIALLELRDDQSEEKRFITNIAADYRLPFLPALRANLNLAYDYNKGEGRIIVPTDASFAFNAQFGGGTNNTYDQTRENSLLEFYLNYKENFDKHSLDLLGGYSWQHFDFLGHFRNSDAAGTPSQTNSDTVGPSEYFLLSYYGRANYGFNDKYLLTLTLRRDGTSRFAPDNRWGLFPAAALGIKILDNDNTRFNSLKLRAGWGITGQQDIGDEQQDYYAYLAQYEYGNESARYQFGQDTIFTIRPNGYDANIKWEETETYNVGLDFSIIRDRFSGSLDLYKRYTTDLLNEVPVPAGTNLTNFIVTNVGNMENQGVEIAFYTVPIQTNKVRWELSANAAYNENEITKLRATDDPTYEGILTGGISGGVGSNIQIYTVGYAPRAFYVFEQLYDENGDILEGQFADRNNDGIVNDQDQYRYAKAGADMTFGFTSRLEIGNFDFSFAGRASVGNYNYNNVQTDMGWLNRLYLSTGGPSLWNVHRSAVDLNVLNQSSLTFSDHFVTKADFLKVDHVTLGYNFNNVIGEFLRFYITAQNVLTSTKYEGLDPEIFSGIDNNVYPRPRTFVFGVNVEF